MLMTGPVDQLFGPPEGSLATRSQCLLPEVLAPCLGNSGATPHLRVRAGIRPYLKWATGRNKAIPDYPL